MSECNKLSNEDIKQTKQFENISEKQINELIDSVYLLSVLAYEICNNKNNLLDNE